MNIEVLSKIHEIDELLNLSFDNIVKFSDLKEWKIGDEKVIEGTVNKKIAGTESECRFITEIPSGLSFKEHWHDCIEECYVLSGILMDSKTGATAKKGEKIVFNKMVKHIPCNPSEIDPLYLIVDFYDK